ncbi:S1C family serine protease [Paenibacillus senegalensis]|uniref:S1C family serine protease n=1 Tax=Paenibacillus senegalensis TaxID=1465766 RepID=UPI00028806CB|nr:trypsin-like peptidase domain-containing protein [Paenibacillus senegalensis]
MGMFRDDFYSTKVSRNAYSGSGYAGIMRHKLLLLLGLAALTGSLLTFIVLTYVLDDGDMGDLQRSLVHSELERVMAVDKVGPAVVSIVSSLEGQDGNTSRSVGVGSGVVYDKKGKQAWVVTNYHVLEEGDAFDVILSNGTKKKAELVGSDRLADLAVLVIDSEGIDTVVEFGDSDSLKAGQTAIAIGNPLGVELSQTVTAGIISRPIRSIPVFPGPDGEYEWELNMIQTDAAINFGNSGGALVNLEGKVVGINSMKVSETGVEGLGFAIPINEVKPIIEELRKKGRISRPFLGVSTVNLQSFVSGLEYLELPEDLESGAIVLEALGPAKEAGLTTNDVIVELDGHPINGTLSLRKYLYQHKKIGDKIDVTYYRQSTKSTVTIKLGENKEQP